MIVRFARAAMATAAVTMAAVATPAVAAPPDLTGKTVQMMIGFGVGGGYDLWGRLIARHIGKHLPGNPQVVPQNVTGGGSLFLANRLFASAPKDGTAFGLIARDAPLAPLVGAAGAQFVATEMSWLGTPTTETNVCVALDTAAPRNAQDLYSKQLIVGDAGVGDGTHHYPKALASILGMKFKLIGGYKSSGDILIAMERGEVEGLCQSISSVKELRPTWIPDGKVRVLVQGGAEPDPSLPDVPYALDLAKTPEHKKVLEFLYVGQGIGRPFVAPPGLSPEVLKMLRDGFDAMMVDPAFLADAKKFRFDIQPRNGAYLQKLIEGIYKTPDSIVKVAAELMK